MALRRRLVLVALAALGMHAAAVAAALASAAPEDADTIQVVLVPHSHCDRTNADGGRATDGRPAAHEREGRTGGCRHGRRRRRRHAAGWKNTFHGYYVEKVQRILDGVLDALEADSRRRFIWSEVSYFARWYDALPPDGRARLGRVVRSGQLEFVGTLSRLC